MRENGHEIDKIIIEIIIKVREKVGKGDIYV